MDALNQMMLSNSVSNLSPDFFDPDLLRHSLKGIPTNRTNYYFETKDLQGFKPNLLDEIHDLLVELQACEENLQRIISIFLLYLQRNDKILSEKDEKIYNLTDENEKLLIKDSFSHNNEPLLQENIALLEKIDSLNHEVELLDRECLRYEKEIEDLRGAMSRSNESLDYKTFFMKYYNVIKIAYPEHFCRCLGHFDELQRENSFIKSEIVNFKREIEEANRRNDLFLEEIRNLKEKIDNTLKENQKILRESHKISIENDELKQEIRNLTSKKSSLHVEEIQMGKAESMVYEVITPKPTTSFELSYFMKTAKSSETPEINIIPQPGSIQQINIQELRSSIRKKSRVFTSYNLTTTLLNEIEKTLKNDNNNNTLQIPNEGFLDGRFSRMRFSMEDKNDEVVGGREERLSQELDEFKELKETFIERKTEERGCLTWFRRCLKGR